MDHGTLVIKHKPEQDGAVGHLRERAAPFMHVCRRIVCVALLLVSAAAYLGPPQPLPRTSRLWRPTPADRRALVAAARHPHIVAVEPKLAAKSLRVERVPPSGNGLDHELLSAEEERALAVEIQLLRRWLGQRREQAAVLGREPTEDEWAAALGCSRAELLRQQERSHDARMKLVELNLRLVQWVVFREPALQGRLSQLPVQDLVQEGVIGLLKAADRYDPARGVRFSTYAALWVRSAVQRSLKRTPAQRAPWNQELAVLGRVFDALEAEHGREPSLEELRREAGRPGLRAQTVARALQQRQGQPASSLDAPAFSQGDATLLDRLAAVGTSGPEAHVDAGLLRAALRDCLRAALAPRAAWVIEARYGLGEGGELPQTSAQVAKQMQLSPTRVLQLERAALATLRKSPQADALRSLLLLRSGDDGDTAPYDI